MALLAYIVNKKFVGPTDVSVFSYYTFLPVILVIQYFFTV